MRRTPAIEPCHDPGFPAGLRLESFACAQLHLAAEHLGAEGERLHDGIHEARKCIRRARSVLRLGRRALGERGRTLDVALGRLCRGLSPLRDAEALIEALRRLDAEADDALAGQLPAAEDAARHQRDRMLARMLAQDPGFARRRQRLLRLQARLSRLDWPSLGERAIARGMARSERRARRAMRRACADPGADARWHAFRRRLRRLRQQLSALDGLGLAHAAVDDALLAQAGPLGETQDDVLLLRHCRKPLFAREARTRIRALARARVARNRQPAP